MLLTWRRISHHSVIAVSHTVWRTLACVTQAGSWGQVLFPVTSFTHIAESLFVLTLIVKLQIKLSGHRLHFFGKEPWHCGLSDLLVILLTVRILSVDLKTAYANYRDSLMFFRASCTARILRILRVFCFRRSAERLRRTLQSMLGSIASLRWDLVLLFIT